MSLYDVLGKNKKHDVMIDTWGHLFPEPSSKHKGYFIISDSDISGQTILLSEFPTLNESPQRAELSSTVFDLYEWPQNSGCRIYRIDCEIWFFKSSNDMYLNKRIGKIIKPKIELVKSF